MEWYTDVDIRMRKELAYLLQNSAKLAIELSMSETPNDPELRLILRDKIVPSESVYILLKLQETIT